MRTRPKIFVGMSAALVGVGASLPVQIMFLYGHAPDEIGAAIAKMAPMNWVVTGLCFFMAWLSWRASPWIKYVAPLTIAAVAWNNAIAAEARLDFSPLANYAAVFGFAALQGAWLHPDARRLLNHPLSRWWLTPRRKRVNLPVFLHTPNRQVVKTATFDLSGDGAYIAFGIRELNDHRDGYLGRLRPGDTIEINIVLNPLRTVSCEALVVRVSREPVGAYPPGVGLRFMQFNGSAKEDLDQLLAA